MEKAKTKLRKQGYKYSDNQHNGILFAKIVGDTLFRAVVLTDGIIKYYRPKKPNKYQKRIFS